MLKSIGNWTVDAGKSDLHFGNMKNLNNSLSVFKHRYYGPRQFYIASNNQCVDTTGWSELDLRNYIQKKYPRDPVPNELFDLFLEVLPSYQESK